MRVFTISTKGRKLKQEQHNLVALLNKFRINCSTVTVIPDDENQLPNQKKFFLFFLFYEYQITFFSLNRFEELIKPFKSKKPSDDRITDIELKINETKTWRYLRLSEILAKHSSEADLIVV